MNAIDRAELYLKLNGIVNWVSIEGNKIVGYYYSPKRKDSSRPIMVAWAGATYSRYKKEARFKALKYLRKVNERNRT